MLYTKTIERNIIESVNLPTCRRRDILVVRSCFFGKSRYDTSWSPPRSGNDKKRDEYTLTKISCSRNISDFSDVASRFHPCFIRLVTSTTSFFLSLLLPWITSRECYKFFETEPEKTRREGIKGDNDFSIFPRNKGRPWLISRSFPPIGQWFGIRNAIGLRTHRVISTLKFRATFECAWIKNRVRISSSTQRTASSSSSSSFVSPFRIIESKRDKSRRYVTPNLISEFIIFSVKIVDGFIYINRLADRWIFIKIREYRKGWQRTV